MWGCEVEQKAPTACFWEPIWTLFWKTEEQFKRVFLQVIEKIGGDEGIRRTLDLLSAIKLPPLLLIFPARKLSYSKGVGGPPVDPQPERPLDRLFSPIL